MISLDIKVCNESFVSIKDLSGDLNISDTKWNSLFELLARGFESFYFLGNRIWSNTDDYDLQTEANFIFTIPSSYKYWLPNQSTGHNFR